ncbi:MAG TPA: DUF3300 domain-containing protein [Burkholderiales bacterium]|nr:DUF3300 domain-containing protein [Burkholderiales bacterium]
MKALAKYLWLRLLLLPLCVSVAFAQTNPPEPAYTQAELDQMLAPIALYPDSLLSQILMAATYPLEVVQAARWSRANSALTGEQAVRAVDDRDWDPSVKSLVAFPQILTMMDTRLEWTERVGDAFLAQQSQVMDTVQGLRQKAYAAGNLRSTEQQRVERQGDVIVVEPADPAIVYVPYYHPAVVYGPWWWPAYPPVYWAPWPGYYAPSGYVGITWSIGIGVGVNFFFGAWDWPHRHIRIVDAHPFYYHRVDRRPLPPTKIWVHTPDHRRGVSYRNPAVRERYRHTIGSPDQRREFRGFVPPAPGARPAPRDRPGTPESRPAPRDRQPPSPPSGSRPPPPEYRVAPPRNVEKLRPNTPVVRPAPAIRPAPEPRPHVFEGVGRGEDARRYSERGRASVQPQRQIRSVTPAPQLRERTQSPPGDSRDNDGSFRRQR